MTKDSIALIGFMATGKTTVGKALVNYLNEDYKFIETDQLIVQETGKKISRIFSEEGEDKFREYEASICKSMTKFSKVVISCGGGIVLNSLNVDNLKKHCHIVLLKASLEEIYKRSKKNGFEIRPIINKENPKKEIMKILNLRKSFYETAAEVVIDTTKKKSTANCRRDHFKNPLKNLNLY